jgi:hypothetical protein
MPFIGYEAAVALAQAVRSLPNHRAELKESINLALSLGLRNPHDQDRIRKGGVGKRCCRMSTKLATESLLALAAG